MNTEIISVIDNIINSIEYNNKHCKHCNEFKDINYFSPNQYGKNNRIVRRGICKMCYSKKKNYQKKI